jgi:hypothetical protein
MQHALLFFWGTRSDLALFDIALFILGPSNFDTLQDNIFLKITTTFAIPHLQLFHGLTITPEVERPTTITSNCWPFDNHDVE